MTAREVEQAAVIRSLRAELERWHDEHCTCVLVDDWSCPTTLLLAATRPTVGAQP